MSDERTSYEDRTIVAVATPAGRGGVGIVRLSGSGSLGLVRALFFGKQQFAPRVARYGVLHDTAGRRVDDALVTYFAAPHSYTGEDVVEVATHGSPVVLDWVVRRCVELGATPARAGEFTERAYLSGRLGLTEAEAVRDLIEAQTLGQARQAAEQMGGSIATAVRPTKQALLELIAVLEAGIDFAEDDLDTVQSSDLLRRIRLLEPPLNNLRTSFRHGCLMREGLRLAIVGEPNVGKSSLFNRLVEHDRAIVTATAGTTRDVVAERIAVGGVPIELLDTAGLRETEDEAERIGVARSRQAMADADAVLVVLDAAQPDLQRALGEAYPLLLGRPVVVAHNKVDLQGHCPMADKPLPALAVDAPRPWTAVQTSAVTGQGIPELREAVLTLASGGMPQAGTATLTNLRQEGAVSRAHAALLRAEDATSASIPHEMILLDLYETLHALDELTGETTPDDVLNLIFSTFCIGK